MESDSPFDIINNMFGTKLDKADRISLEYIIKNLLDDKKLRKMAKVNSIEDFRYAFNRFFQNLVIEKMKNDSLFFKRIIDDLEYKQAVIDYLLPETYKKLNSS